MDSGPLHEDCDSKYKLNKDEGKLFINCDNNNKNK